MLSEEQKKEYVENKGFYCPYCGGTSVIADGPVNLDGDEGDQRAYCEDCEKAWFDIYTITGIMEETDNGNS